MKFIQNIKSMIPLRIKQQLTRTIWVTKGRPVPPPHIIKQLVIKQYQRATKYRVFIETGTFHGRMVEAQMNNFKKIYSIELSKKLFKKAKSKFTKYSHIELLNGDSGRLIKGVCNKIDEPAVFWLDAHYSGGITAKDEKETPIIEELRTILKTNQKHIILIDDARHFVGKNDYPTIVQLKSFVNSENKQNKFEVKNDIIRILPKTISKLISIRNLRY